jgi:hypothetical protein
MPPTAPTARPASCAGLRNGPVLLYHAWPMPVRIPATLRHLNGPYAESLLRRSAACIARMAQLGPHFREMSFLTEMKRDLNHECS